MKEIWNSDIHGSNAEVVEDFPPKMAMAIDKDKGSQIAFKWMVENLLTKGKTVTLIHIKKTSTNSSAAPFTCDEFFARELFLPFRCFCTRKDIQCRDVILEDTDIAKAIAEYATANAVEKLVVGAPNRSAFARFKTTDVASSVAKAAPDFCTVYVISKGKVSSVRNAIRQAPMSAGVGRPLQNQASSIRSCEMFANPPPMPNNSSRVTGDTPRRSSFEGKEMIRSPFTRGRASNGRLYGELTAPETDISFVSSGRPSTDYMFPSLLDEMEGHRPSRASNFSSGFDSSSNFDMMRSPLRSSGSSQFSMMDNESNFSQQSGTTSRSSNATPEDVEAEMRRLRLELKQTMDMYSTACREALTAKQKAGELHRWKMEEEQRMQESRLSEETALAIVEREKAKCRAAIEAAEAAKRIAELESQKRKNVEMKALKEAEERKRAMDAIVGNDERYRKYTIEEIEVATQYFSQGLKIGEGGYGPVYRCILDHTEVAVKVLRPDAAQGRSQFQQEIEVLSCMRHPNMVLLMGACPEYGCLVYEYMANGSLEDRLFRKGNTPTLSWQLRFRIAAEIATGLLFLHQAKPEPLVHRDLKPANILLDRNYIAKIADVGLARLVPPSVANAVTQYRMTSAAGTFCYIDPEYQQTGMLGIKSDIYSVGIMLLQIITARPPMGLAHYVERAIEKGTFEEMLDPQVKDWPVEDALIFAKMAMKCAELRRKDRPDLGKDILPELNRLRTLAEESMYR